MDTFDRRRWVLAAAGSLLGVLAPGASAQGYPGGGGMRRSRDNSTSIEERLKSEKAREPAMAQHPLALFAAGLEREAPNMKLTPAAATATASFIRELKDFAGLEDRQVRERMGQARGVVHATVDLQRDLNEIEDSAHELEASAKDVIARWKSLRELLDDTQRERVQGLYAAALLDSRQPARERQSR